MCDDCRPLGFLIGLPFMLVAALLSLIGMVIWVIATILGCCCPCFICCAGIANIALSLIKAPVNVISFPEFGRLCSYKMEKYGETGEYSKLLLQKRFGEAARS